MRGSFPIVLAACAASVGCAGRTRTDGGPSSQAQAPAASAPRKPAVARFPRLVAWGPAEARGYRVTHRMRARITDVATGQIVEQGSSLERTELTRALPDGLETQVVHDLETTGVMPVTPTLRPAYTVTVKGSEVTVQVKGGASLDAAYEGTVRQRAGARGPLAELLDVLGQGTFHEGVPVALPASFVALLAASASGSATLVAVEDRWQRRVAHLRIELARAATADAGELRGAGELYVELETGRPISLAVEMRTHRRWTVEGREVEARSVEVSTRRWGFHRSDRPAGSSFAADPAPSVLGEARQVVIAPDERTAAVLLARPTGNELAIWDLGRRAVLESRASSALHVMAEAAGEDGTMVHEVSRADVTTRLRTAGGMQAFGQVLFMDMSFEPSAAAASGPWIAVGADDGRVVVADPRYACVRGAFPSGLARVRAMAFPSHERLVVVDDQGKVVVLALAQGGARAPHQRACDGGGLRASPARPSQLDDSLARGLTAAGSPLTAIGRSGRVGVSAVGSTLVLFEPGSGREAARLETSVSPPSGAVLSGRALVAAGHGAGGAQVVTWDLASASARSEALGSGAVTLAATADGARHVIAAADRVEVRDTRSGKVVARRTAAELGAAGGVLGAALGRDGASVALLLGDGALAVRDVATGRALAASPAGSAGGPSSFALSPTEDLLLSVGTTGRLVATEIPAGRVRFDVEATSPATAVPGKIVAVSADGAWLAIAGTRRGGTPWNPQIPVVEVRSTRDGALVVALSPTWDDLTALAFSADRALLFAGSKEGRLLTWDTASGVLVSSREAHARAVTSLFAAAGGETLVSTSTDGSVRLWRARAVEEPRRPIAGVLGAAEEVFVPWRPAALIATLMVDARGSAIAATGDGYYKADRGNLRALALTSGLLRHEFRQFDALLHRPDLVVERLGAGAGDDLALFRAAHAKRVRLLEGAIPRSLPEPPAVVLVDRLPLMTPSREIALDLRVDAGAGKLRALHVAVNSVPVGAVGGTPITGPRWTGEVPLTLGSGANRVEVFATDDRGAASQIESHVIEYTGATRQPSLYAVVVGVSRYANPKLDLSYAAKDATDVGAVLAASRRFAKVHVHTILDERATRANITAARAFLEQADVDDTVVVFLAGHGMLDRNLDYYFGTTDIDPRAPAKAGLPYADLTSLVTGLKARRRLVLMDTCHAGEADRAAPWTPPATLTTARPRVKTFRGLELVRPVPDDQSFGLMLQLFTDLRDGSGAIVVGSAGGAELALEGARYRNGVFTFALLEALREDRGDTDASGTVTATELVRYVRSRVHALTGGAQRPVTRGENLDLDFPIH